MKITIEDTEKKKEYGQFNRKVSVSDNSDELGTDDAIDLMKTALRLYGYVLDDYEVDEYTKPE